MTQLIDVRKTQKVILPSYPDVEILMYDTLLTYEVEELRKLDDDFLAGIETIKRLIKSWGFTDEAEKPLEVSIDNLKKLPSSDFMALLAVVENATKTNEAKKN